ncbi:P-loop NTPase fold protein [Vibrio parahaemolyticus]|uniref:P-loop NTPase fold protein n=2 Tax=Vibrio parahaemolyticus TaxID=670 RepID=UPI00336560AE
MSANCMRLNMKTEERIHSLLEDRSFPSMILLDGHWGVGKTHFVKYSLKLSTQNLSKPSTYHFTGSLVSKTSKIASFHWLIPEIRNPTGSPKSTQI